jgi:photosystem II stability/assembly factor-like uncharacterized protein
VAIPRSGDAAGMCRNDVERRNEWHAVPPPPVPVRTVAQADNDPCALLAGDRNGTVWSSADGGTTWAKAGSLPGPAVATLTEGLAERRAAALVDRQGEGTGASGELWVTGDSGRTWKAAGGMAGRAVTGVFADPTSAQTVYAVARADAGAGVLPVPTPLPYATIFKSTDFGATFTPVAGSTGMQPHVLAVDPRRPDTIWADSEPGSAVPGLYLSKDGGSSFQRVAAIDVNDLDVVADNGGGSVVLAATPSGIYRTTTEGQDSTTVAQGDDVSAVGVEREHSGAYLALVGGTPRRTSTEGREFHAADRGFPRDCDPTRLTGDHSVPTTFLATCADGRVLRYRSDGVDFGGREELDPGSQAPLYDPTRTAQMPLLRKLAITQDGQQSSGVVAFDGQYLYYVGEDDPGVVHRMTTDGAEVADLHLRIGGAIRGLTYDSANHRMFVETKGAQDQPFRVYSVDLRDDAVRYVFDVPAVLGLTDQNGNESSPVLSYDPSTGRFRGNPDISYEVYELDLRGRITGHCTIPNVLLGGTGIGPGGGAVASDAAIAGLVSSGDGGFYAQLENDTTVLRLSRTCELRAIFDHPRFSESFFENDQIACDTTTFAQPAIWLRDATDTSLTAFGVPGGYCPLATSAGVTTDPVVSLSGSSTVCASLRLAGRGVPVAGETVSLLVGGYPVASPATDGRGVACATFVPARYPGLVDAVRSRVPGKERRVTQPVVASYAGTIAYRPAVATGRTVVTSARPAVVPHRPDPPGGPAAPGPVRAPRGIAPPPVQPGQPVLQIHPNPQANPNTNPQAQANPQGGAAPQEEEQPELALVTGDTPGLGQEEYAMVGLGALAVTAMFAAGCAAARRTAPAMAPTGSRAARSVRLDA